MGKSNMTNLVDSDDIGAWSVIGTPVVTATDDPFGGSDAWNIEDNDSGGEEVPYRPVVFTGDGQKIVEFVLRRGPDASASGEVALYSTTASAYRARGTVTWVAGTPSILAIAGEVVDVRRDRRGYWIVRMRSSTVTASQTHWLWVLPADAVGSLGDVDVYRIRAYNSAVIADAWSWMDVLGADVDNATVCGYYTGLDVTSASEVLSKFAESIGAWWGPDRSGVYRLQVVKDPQLASNLFTFPRELDNAAWAKTQATITPNDRIAAARWKRLSRRPEG